MCYHEAILTKYILSACSFPSSDSVKQALQILGRHFTTKRYLRSTIKKMDECMASRRAQKRTEKTRDMGLQGPSQSGETRDHAQDSVTESPIEGNDYSLSILWFILLIILGA